MKWFRKQMDGRPFFEYREDKESHKNYFFDIQVNGDGTVRLYDLRDNPATYYLFADVKTAKKVAVESITNKEVLKPYYDTAWYDLADKTAKTMEKARKLLDSLK